MAIAEPRYIWKIDQMLQPMMAELGLKRIAPTEAVARVATRHAEETLLSGADPLTTRDFFFRLWIAADHPIELGELANLDDLPYTGMSIVEEQEFALQALIELAQVDSLARRTGQQRLEELRSRRSC